MVLGRVAGSHVRLMQSLGGWNETSSGIRMQDITHIFMHLWPRFSVKLEGTRTVCAEIKSSISNLQQRQGESSWFHFRNFRLLLGLVVFVFLFVFKLQ